MFKTNSYENFDSIELKKRNLQFYKLLGQNYLVLVNAILRGKDIYYEIPKEYGLNTKHPLILDWLLDYGRPSQISQVRSLGAVKLLCIYNALMTWIDQHPDDADNWVYKEEWEDFFRNNPKAFQKPNTNGSKKAKGVKPMEVVLPKLNFITKKQHCHFTSHDGDVYIRIYDRKPTNCMNISFRHNSHKKLNSDYAVFAVLNNRLYFNASTIEEGYKLTKKANQNILSASLNKSECSLLQPFANKELELKYDEIYKMHYVEIDE